MPSSRSNTRVVVSLKGNLRQDAMAQLKYGQLVRALNKYVALAGVFDVSLGGLSKASLALKTLHPVRREWRNRYTKHPQTFVSRSLRVSEWVSQQDADAVVQIGALFNSNYAQDKIPSVIYTDYTSRLSAKHKEGSRSPYEGAMLEEWLSLEKQSYDQAAHVCVRSKMVRASLVDDYGLPPEKISVIGGGANLGIMPGAITRPLNQPPHVLFIGQNFYRKGGDLVLKAFAEVRKQIPQSRLTMVTQLPRNHGLPMTNVEVVDLNFDRNRVRRQFSLADVFVLPSRLETWGDVIIEAMAFGIACVGVTGQPMEEIIVHNETGLLAEPENPQALGDAMVQLLSDRSQCRVMGAAGRSRFEKEYTWSNVAGKLCDVVETVVQHNRAGL